MYYPSQTDINMLAQSNKIINVYIELLNLNYQRVDTIEGLLLEDSFSFDATSDNRRTYQLTFLVNNKDFAFGLEKKLWLDKLLKIDIGIQDIVTRKEHKYPMGVYVFEDGNFEFSGDTSTLSLSCGDLVSTLNGTVGGKLIGSAFIEGGIDEGITIREAMVNFVSSLPNIKAYRISNMPKIVPFKQEFDQNSTAWNVITKLRDLYAGWETFFDIDGTFVCQPIPTTKDDEAILAKEQMKELVISENSNQPIKNIRNVSKVAGKCLNADHYSETSTGTGSTYTVTFAKTPTFKTGLTIAFKCNVDNNTSPKVIINGTSYNIVDDNENGLSAGKLKANTDYVFRFRNDKFYYQGEWQIVGIAIEVNTMPSQKKIKEDYIKYNTRNIKYIVNPDSPYSIERIGERFECYNGGVYEDIYSEDLALQRAEFELWKTTRMTETLSLEMLLIPWFNMNEKIEYTKKQTEETYQYITKKMSGSAKDCTMTLECARFYPLYPDIVEE